MTEGGQVLDSAPSSPRSAKPVGEEALREYAGADLFAQLEARAAARGVTVEAYVAARQRQVPPAGRRTPGVRYVFLDK